MALLAEAAVDWDQLLEVVWTSLVGGIGVTAVFAVALYGAVKTADVRRDGPGLALVAYAAMALVASAVVIASIVFAITTITGK